MQRHKGQRHDQPANPGATILPCRIRITPAPATPGQRQAWSCLWRRLLSERAARQEEAVEGKETLNL
jgi:hypothetical protein